MRDLILLAVLVFVLVAIIPMILANVARDLASRNKVKAL